MDGRTRRPADQDVVDLIAVGGVCGAGGLGPANLVLYDVSTRYLETGIGDGFREPDSPGTPPGAADHPSGCSAWAGEVTVSDRVRAGGGVTRVTGGAREATSDDMVYSGRVHQPSLTVCRTPQCCLRTAAEPALNVKTDCITTRLHWCSLPCGRSRPLTLTIGALPQGVTAPKHRSKRDVRRRCRFIDTLSVSDRDCPWLILWPGRAAVPTFGMSCLPCPQSGRVGFAFIGT